MRGVPERDPTAGERARHIRERAGDVPIEHAGDVPITDPTDARHGQPAPGEAVHRDPRHAQPARGAAMGWEDEAIREEDDPEDPLAPA